MKRDADIIPMLDGMSKMVNDAGWQSDVAKMKQTILEGWPSMTANEQEGTYTKVCQLFLEATGKCLGLMRN